MNILNLVHIYFILTHHSTHSGNFSILKATISIYVLHNIIYTTSRYKTDDISRKLRVSYVSLQVSTSSIGLMQLFII